MTSSARTVPSTFLSGKHTDGVQPSPTEYAHRNSKETYELQRTLETPLVLHTHSTFLLLRFPARGSPKAEVWRERLALRLLVLFGAQDDDDCRRTIQGFQIGLGVHIDGMYGLKMMCEVIEKGECGRMHGWRIKRGQCMTKSIKMYRSRSLLRMAYASRIALKISFERESTETSGWCFLLSY